MRIKFDIYIFITSLFNRDCNFRINPDLRYIVYCTALRTGGEKEWDFVYSQYKQAVVASEQDNLLRALACSEVPWILQRSVFERSYALLKMTIICYYYYHVVRFDDLHKGQYRKVKCTSQNDNNMLLLLACEVPWILQRSVQKGQIYFSRWQYYMTTII